MDIGILFVYGLVVLTAMLGLIARLVLRDICLVIVPVHFYLGLWF